jgi:shikimate 5-dehydrogenase
MDGKGMLLYQAAAAFEIWTGLDAPIEVMRAALHEAMEEAHI